MFKLISTLIITGLISSEIAFSFISGQLLYQESTPTRQIASIQYKNDPPALDVNEQILKKLDLEDTLLNLGGEVVVAVLDTGIDLSNGDLMARVYKKDGRPVMKDITSLDGVDDMRDLHGHGTSIATIITTINPRTKIIPIKVHDGFDNRVLTYESAIDWIVENHPEVRVVNISMAGNIGTVKERESIIRARKSGVTFVVSAGNDGKNMNDVPSYPASYFSNGYIISVGATGKKEGRQKYSNYGENFVDFMAQGDSFSFYYKGFVKKLSGTSQSAAVVSAMASHVLSHNPEATPDDVKLLLEECSHNSSKKTSRFGKISYKTLVTNLIISKRTTRNLVSRSK